TTPTGATPTTAAPGAPNPAAPTSVPGSSQQAGAPTSTGPAGSGPGNGPNGGSGANGGGSSGGSNPQAPGARFLRSTLARSVASPRNVSTDARRIAVNALVAAVIVLLIAFPAHVFNLTLAENYDEVLGWVRPSKQRVLRARRIWSDAPTWVSVGGLAVIGALLFGFLDPRFGFNRGSFALLLGLITALVIVTGVYDVARARYLQRRFGVQSYVRGYPGGLVVAALLVMFSRVAHFNPGYLFGVFTALNFRQAVDERDDGRGVAVASLWLLGVAVVSWFAWGPVSEAAIRPNPSFAVLLLDAVLSTIWIAGVQGMVFGLLPLRFMDGEKVVAWSRRGWVVIYALGTFAFIHTMLNPGPGVGQAHRSVLPALLLFLVFAVGSFLFWAYFRFRPPRSGAAYRPPEEHPESVPG
ncbi:MAG: hypothetical protein JWN46_3957, partial [Acidimicrobiales bacterium]|nr:hypothetical protein [Acidimicrobiales bacterium]